MFVVPVDYLNVPKNVEIDDTIPNEARVAVFGSSQAFHFLAPSNLKVSIDLTEARNGKDAFTITDNNVRHPHNLTVYRIESTVSDPGTAERLIADETYAKTM